MTWSARIALLAAALSTSCLVRGLRSRQLTGTCEGACSHYLECRGGEVDGDSEKCVGECREIFSDSESLRSFESLSCQDAVEFVDGKGARADAGNHG